MGERGSRERPDLLSRAAEATTRHPRVVIGIWLVVFGALAALGVGVGDKLSTRPVFVDGSAAQRAHEIAVREFGDEDAFIVMLRGPRASVDQQGRQLLRRFESTPGAVAISPWSSGGTIAGLRPAPGVAAMLLEVTPSDGQGTLELVNSIKGEVDAAIEPPVRADVAGGQVSIDSFHRAAEDAAATGEKIAIPALLIILLIVFRSVLAAAIPVVVGGAVVAATRGVMDLLVGFVHIESFALGPAGMMGLALGVDYSLLVVSRFREELASSDDVGRAVRATVRSTGRAVIPAGCGLIFAMVVGSFVLPSPLLVSAALVVIAVAMLSVVSAILFTPAVLMLLGPNLDRWALPIRPRGRSVFSRWSESMSRRPLALASIMAILIGLAVWAFNLQSEAATVALLPGKDAGRVQQEKIEAGMGPGWVAPIEVVMNGRDRPVTTPQRLRALARFQRQVEADPDVTTMAGLAPIERSVRGFDGEGESPAAGAGGLARLERGIAGAHAGSASAVGKLAGAAAGADQLSSATDSAARGSGQLSEGLEAAGHGTGRLAGGLDRTSSGSDRLANGMTRASRGSDQLASGLARAQRQGSQATNSSHLLENSLRDGEESLTDLPGHLQESETQLGIALEALRELDSDSSDPRYARTLQAVEAADEQLTGASSSTGERTDPSYEGVGAGVRGAEHQFSLSTYLAHRSDKNGKQAVAGLKKLQRSASRLAGGLDRLTAGSKQIAYEIGRLRDGGAAVPAGLRNLTVGAQRLTDGLNEVSVGADGLAEGIGGGATELGKLTDGLAGIEDGVKRQAASPLGGAGLERLQDQSPRLFKSGYFYLASLDGSEPQRRRQAAFLINLDHGGHAARMLVIPRHGSVSSQTDALQHRMDDRADDLARATGSEVVVGGIPAIQADLNQYYRDQAPFLRLALLLVSVVVLFAVLRSLLVPIIAALLNLITVAASFGVLALLFNDSFIGGPGYVDSTVVPATIMVMFGLSIDYEVFLFARMREEYVRTGSPALAVKNGVDHTAHVITGAAIIMIVVFIAFSLSPFVTIRDFGVAQAIAVFIDAFIIRLIIVPALMRSMGKWAWWLPRPLRRTSR